MLGTGTVLMEEVSIRVDPCFSSSLHSCKAQKHLFLVWQLAVVARTLVCASGPNGLGLLCRFIIS